ncbi:replication initiation protein [Romboutsia maritimum]|uniref:replication initiation protein n=1 Tax=Romboutsia maritimum TaxID=2020948 RepID=UPI002692C67F|nr:replication initiation protein [Romboutsia maritimum]
MESGYTPNNLAVLFGLGNYYAQRLYDLLRLWSGTKSIITYSVDELKMYLSLEGKYGDYNTFKRRVILPAIKALVGIGCFEIDIKENKVGRKVDSIDFIVKDLDKRKYFTKDDTTKAIPSEVIEEVAVTLDNKIVEYKIEEKEDIKHKKEMDMHW